MPDDNSVPDTVADTVADTVTAPVEPTDTEAHEILNDAIEGAQNVADASFDMAHETRVEGEREADRIADNAGDAIDRAGILSTVQEAMDAHVREHHTEPVIDEPTDETHEAAVTIDVPPLDEIAPEVQEGGGDNGDSVTVSRRRRVFTRRR